MACSFTKNKVLNSYFPSMLISVYGIYGFVHAHEQVYSPLLHLIWKDKDLYANVIPILGGLGGFHQRGFQELRTEIGLLIQRLLHQDQGNKVFKDGITFGLCAYTRKRLQQLFKQK